MTGLFTNQNKPKTLELFFPGIVQKLYFFLQELLFQLSFLNKVQELFMRHQQIFSRKSNNLGYCDKINIKLDSTKIHSRSEEIILFSLSFDKKSNKKNVEFLEEAKLIEATHSYWSAHQYWWKKDGS